MGREFPRGGIVTTIIVVVGCAVGGVGCASENDVVVAPLPDFVPEPDPICTVGMFRAEVGRTGITASPIPRDEPELVWALNLHGEVVGDGPPWLGGYEHGDEPGDEVVEDPNDTENDVVFLSPTPIPCGDLLVVGWMEGLRVVERATGEEVWQLETREPVHGTPVVADGIAYFGANDDFVRAMNIATGEIVWQNVLRGDTLASPALVGGRVFTSDKVGFVESYDRESGELLWEVEIGNTVSASASFNSTADLMAMGSRYGPFVGFDPADGDVDWEFTAGNHILSTAAQYDDTYYVGSWDNKLYAVDAATAAERWSFETGANITASPAVDADLVVLGGWDWNVYALDRATGDEVWRQELHSDVLSSPVMNGDTVLIVLEDGTVLGLDREHGTILWEITVDTRVVSTPAVAPDGTFYFKTMSGDLYAFGPAS